MKYCTRIKYLLIFFRPVIFALKNQSFEVNLVLSTLCSDLDSQAETILTTKPQETSMRGTARNKRVPKRISNKSSSKIQNKSIKSIENDIHKKSHSNLMKEQIKQASTSTQGNQNVNRISNLPIKRNIDEKFHTSSYNSDIITNFNKTSISGKKLVNSIFPTITKGKSNNNETDKEENLDDDQSDVFEDKILNSPSPPNKKARLIFQKCFQKTFDPGTLPGYDIILAEDSDEDSDE
mgnify:CR=1 FL=1